uniref:Protein kinase domain-containing protein n=1 Tax=Rhizophora mucronata TaxID=61149 RepID=A0A2P2JND2_RHIMU
MKVAFEMARLLELMHSSTDHLLPYSVQNMDAKHIMLNQDCNSYLFDLSMISGGILTDERMILDFVTCCIGYVDPYFAREGIGWSKMNDVCALAVCYLD